LLKGWKLKAFKNGVDVLASALEFQLELGLSFGAGVGIQRALNVDEVTFGQVDANHVEFALKTRLAHADQQELKSGQSSPHIEATQQRGAQGDSIGLFLDHRPRKVIRCAC
jgi:hypothetical protein